MQIKTGTLFDATTRLTLEDERNVVMASRLLNGERIQSSWERRELHITPDGRAAVGAALEASSPIRNTRVRGNLTLVVQEQTVPIGDTTQVLESARVLSWEGADDDGPPGTTLLCLVPVDTDTVTTFLDSSEPPRATLADTMGSHPRRPRLADGRTGR